jgi:hypothetical protein
MSSLELQNLNEPRHSKPRNERTARRQRRGGRGLTPQPMVIPVTEEGFPAAVPDIPPPSPAVFTSDAARSSYPWLPGRVIAGSIWRGPAYVKVRVDASGEAAPWPLPRP